MQKKRKLKKFTEKKKNREINKYVKQKLKRVHNTKKVKRDKV